MRATIVERKDAPAVVDDQDWTVTPVNNEPSLCPEFCEAPCAREFRCRRILGRSPFMGPKSSWDARIFCALLRRGALEDLAGSPV